MDLTTLWQAWPLPGPWRVELLAQRNHQVHLVETPGSGRYILRVSPPRRDLKRLRYELAVVTGLQQAPLSFVVPAPLPTSAEELWLAVQDGPAAALATLWPFVPGQRPEQEHLEQTEAAGRVLAELDQALAMRAPPLGVDLAGTPPVGDLRQRVSLDEDPLQVPGQLPLDRANQARLTRLFEHTLERIPSLYTSLPQQLIHGDYDACNLLVEGNRVTGVLDFELSGVDLRVMDLANALLWWSADLLGTGKEWGVLEALSRGYAEQVQLGSEELEAIPTLMRLRLVGAVLYRVVRCWQGEGSMEAVLERVRLLFWREDWLQANQAELLRRLRRGHAT